MVSGVGRVSVQAPCEVCGLPKVKGKRTLVWTPDRDERDRYKKVWVHPDCRQRLLDGERPPGVEVRGVPDHQLLEIVLRCENQLGSVAPELIRTPPIGTADRRKVREREAMMLRARVEQSTEPIDVEQLRGTINGLQRQRKELRRPRDLVAQWSRLRRAGHFRPDPVFIPDDGIPF